MSRRPRRTAKPAFLFFGVFAASRNLLDEARRRLEARYGKLHADGVSEVFDFPDTVAYRESMGTGLVRQFFVLAERWPQDGLAAVKNATIEMEEEIRDALDTSVERPVNIDPGLINDCRVILATTKDFSHRLYRGDGIWEEVTLAWRDGAYRSFPWTYSDFDRPSYHAFFATLRDEFLRDS